MNENPQSIDESLILPIDQETSIDRLRQLARDYKEEYGLAFSALSDFREATGCFAASEIAAATAQKEEETAKWEETWKGQIAVFKQACADEIEKNAALRADNDRLIKALMNANAAFGKVCKAMNQGVQQPDLDAAVRAQKEVLKAVIDSDLSAAFESAAKLYRQAGMIEEAERCEKRIPLKTRI